MYVHAGANKGVWARDRMLQIAQRFRVPLQTQPGWHNTQRLSDYTAFNKAGIPVVA